MMSDAAHFLKHLKKRTRFKRLSLILIRKLFKGPCLKNRESKIKIAGVKMKKRDFSPKKKDVLFKTSKKISAQAISIRSGPDSSRLTL